jgi:parallel beta-helix repeat protein
MWPLTRFAVGRRLAPRALTSDQPQQTRRSSRPVHRSAGDTTRAKARVSAGLSRRARSGPKLRNIQHPHGGAHTRAALSYRAAILTVAATAFTALGAGPALAGTSTCGDTITADTTLHADLTNCPGDGLVIGADNVKLDLDRHTIEGAGAADSAGIRLAGHHGVTVSRGSLQEFGTGVLLDNADGNTLARVAVTATVARGIQLQNGSDGNRLESDIASATGRSGFGLFDSSRNVITHATASSNPFSGVMLFSGAHDNRISGGTFSGNAGGIGFAEGADHNIVVGNVITASQEIGVAIDEANDNLVTGNRLAHNSDGIRFGGDHNRIAANLITDSAGCPEGCGSGIAGEGGTGNLVEVNTIIGTELEGIRLNEFQRAGGAPGISTVFRGNVVRDAGTDGIGVGTSTDENSGTGILADTLVVSNVVTGSGHDGINVASASTTVTRNLALHNGNLGIEAVDGVTDGGGNHAFANGNPVQCLNVAC